ncbi:MAG TPA: hypothetical protein VN519_06800 [Bryobacteraceae bacterium]|nr:hypothetical protein [Bryobacteraceae bacterium]
MQITIQAAQVSPSRWVTFTPSADLKDYDPAVITAWVIEYKRPNTGTIIDAQSGVEEFGARRNPQGNYVNPATAAIAYEASYAKVHLISVAGPELSITGEITKEKVYEIPMEILTAFVTRTDPTTRVSAGDIQSLKVKPAADDPTP